jgi:protein-tyrosine-phosphatase
MEYRMQHLLKQQQHNQVQFANIIVKSRSVSKEYEPEGSPASDQGMTVMREDYNCSMDAHRSTLLTDADVKEATLIVPVKRDLGNFIGSKFTGSKSKIFNLSEDIEDPWHAPVSVFRSCVQQIDRLLPELLSEIVLKQTE